MRSHDGHKNLSAATIVVFVSDAMTLRKELEKRGKVKPGPRQLASVFSLFFASEGISAAETCDVRGLEHVKLFFGEQRYFSVFFDDLLPLFGGGERSASNLRAYIQLRS